MKRGVHLALVCLKLTKPPIRGVTASQPPSVFKAQLFALSGVAPERMKLMLKGVQVKDEDMDWARFKGLQTVRLGRFLLAARHAELSSSLSSSP